MKTLSPAEIALTALLVGVCAGCGGGGGGGGSSVNSADRNATAALGSNRWASIAVNPVAPPGGGPNTVVVASTDSASGFAGVRLSKSIDGGVTWSSSLLAPTPAPAGQGRYLETDIAYDKFGNLFIAYAFELGTGAAPPNSVWLVESADDGATVAASLHVDAVDAANGDDVYDVRVATGPSATNPGKESAVMAFVSYASNALRNEDIRVAGFDGIGQLDDQGVGPLVATVTDAPSGVDIFVSQPDVAFGPAGQMYVSWVRYTANSPSSLTPLFMDVDPDGLLGASPFGADITIPTISGVSYQETTTAGLATVALRLAVVRAGAFAGRVVFAFADEVSLRPGFPDTQVRSFFTDDDGATFSPIVNVNDVATNQQLLPSIAADPTTGDLHAVWLDSRNDAGGATVQTFGASSADGGATWGVNVRVSDGASDFTGQTNDAFGHLGLIVRQGVPIAAWPDNSARADNPDEPAFDVLVSAWPVP